MAFSAGTTRSAAYKVLATDYNNTINNVNYLGSGTPGTGRASVMATSVLNTSLTTATWTQMLFASEDFDTSAMHSTVTNTGRLTVPAGEGGLYYVEASAVITPAGGAFGLQVRKNGAASTAPTLQNAVANFSSVTANLASTGSVNGIVRLAAGDYLELYCIQNSGGALALMGSTQAHRFGALWLSA